jgi:hypothetical protein
VLRAQDEPFFNSIHRLSAFCAWGFWHVTEWIAARGSPFPMAVQKNFEYPVYVVETRI